MRIRMGWDGFVVVVGGGGGGGVSRERADRAAGGIIHRNINQDLVKLFFGIR